MKQYIATRFFRDAGTERSFTEGEVLTDVKPDAIANYAAAGLVAEAPLDLTEQVEPTEPTE